MSTTVALARREAALDKRETSWRASQRIARFQEQALEKVGKAKAALVSVRESSQAAIAINGGARVGGMALESFARRKIAADKAKLIGPAATVGAIACYTLGMAESKASNQYALFTAAGIFEGAATRFLLEMVDGLTEKV